MAIWQLAIRLKCGKKKAESLDFRRFAELFPEEKSWCSGARQFGSIESTCLELFAGEEPSLRLDLRSLTREQLNGIVAFATENGLKLKKMASFTSRATKASQRSSKSPTHTAS